MHRHLLNAYALTFQPIIKTLFSLQTSSTLWSMPTNQPQHTLFRNKKSSLSHTLLLTLLPFTIAPTPPTPSPFPDHHSLYLLSFIPCILEHCPLHLTSCMQHTSIFLNSSQIYPPFHSDYLNSTSKPAFQSAHQASRQTARSMYHLPFHGRQVSTTPTVGLLDAHNHCLPWITRAR